MTNALPQQFQAVVNVPTALVQNVFDAVQGGVYSGWIGELHADVNDLPNSSVVYDRADDAEGSFGGRMEITAEKINGALALMAMHSGKRFTRVVDDSADAEDADVFMQFLVFGEIIYG